MGREYRISVTPGRAAELKDWLVRRGARFTTHEKKEMAEFRFAAGADLARMPDAVVVLEEDGVYFCDNLGDREKTATIFQALVDEALIRSGQDDYVTIRSL